MWVRETLEKWKDHMEYHQLVQKLCQDDGRFKDYLGVSHVQFDNLLSVI